MQFVDRFVRPTQQLSKMLKAHRIGRAAALRDEGIQLKPAWNFKRKQYFPLMPLETKRRKPHKYQFTWQWCGRVLVWSKLTLSIAPKKKRKITANLRFQKCLLDCLINSAALFRLDRLHMEWLSIVAIFHLVLGNLAPRTNNSRPLLLNVE